MDNFSSYPSVNLYGASSLSTTSLDSSKKIDFTVPPPPPTSAGGYSYDYSRLSVGTTNTMPYSTSRDSTSLDSTSSGASSSTTGGGGYHSSLVPPPPISSYDYSSGYDPYRRTSTNPLVNGGSSTQTSTTTGMPNPYTTGAGRLPGTGGVPSSASTMGRSPYGSTADGRAPGAGGYRGGPPPPPYDSRGMQSSGGYDSFGNGRYHGGPYSRGGYDSGASDYYSGYHQGGGGGGGHHHHMSNGGRDYYRNDSYRNDMGRGGFRGASGGDHSYHPYNTRSIKPPKKEIMNQGDIEKSKCIFVGNIPYHFRKQDLMDIFGKFGTLTNVNVGIDKRTGKSRGYAFVEFENKADAIKAFDEFTVHEVQGRKLRLDWDLGIDAKKTGPGPKTGGYQSDSEGPSSLHSLTDSSTLSLPPPIDNTTETQPNNSNNSNSEETTSESTDAQEN